MHENLHVIILAGGKGVRLWPMSRSNYPKQFIPLGGGRSLYESSLARALKLAPEERIHVVTVCEFADHVSVQSSKMARQGTFDILFEPTGRNTLPAVILGCFGCTDDDVVLVMTADHLIPDEEAFAADVDAAAAAASEGRFVVFGIEPDRPETGFGYIHSPGADDGVRVRPVDRFVEKPDAATAASYLAAGEYFWNSGMFVFKAGAFRDAVGRHAPEYAEAMASGRDAFMSRYGTFKSLSIDYGIMERLDIARIGMVKASFRWNDMGSFESLHDTAAGDGDGNVIIGGSEGIVHKGANNFIRTEDKLVVMSGLDDVMVVDTEDALLVMRRGSGQNVREIFDMLESRGRRETGYHRTGYRPWGSYKVLLEGERYKIKKISVNPGAALSLQLHHHRSEHWVVIQGVARVTVGESAQLVHENESVFIPKSTRHRLENPGKVELQIIEVQNGEYVEEDDIVRLEDSYGRC